MKGFIDTIPKELEEAAYIDGASANQTFFKIMLPLAMPGLAVTALLGFMDGWQEFALSWQFISNPELVHALHGPVWLQGECTANWGQFTAMEHRRIYPRCDRLLCPAEVHRGWSDVG